MMWYGRTGCVTFIFWYSQRSRRTNVFDGEHIQLDSRMGEFGRPVGGRYPLMSFVRSVWCVVVAVAFRLNVLLIQKLHFVIICD